MHSHHSHSNYIAHGQDPLDDVVNRAKQLQMKTYGLTEHMPRLDANLLYPEERDQSDPDALKTLQTQFQRFLIHAHKIKDCLINSAGELSILVGMEVEACDTKHIAYAKRLFETHGLQYMIGSVHHVRGVPIDFDRTSFEKAVSACGGTEPFLMEYYDLQYEMLSSLHPQVVGHMDLFRLFLEPMSEKHWLDLYPRVRAAVIRNLQYIDFYGGAIEINTSALRKGLRDPYPDRKLCNLALEHTDARFVLSDDAHCVQHVATNYGKAIEYIQNVLNLESIHFLRESDNNELELAKVTVRELRQWVSHSHV